MTWISTETRRITKPWGIEITVQFERDTGEIRTKTFRFDSEKQIKTGFESRMIQAKQNLQNDLDAATYEERYPSNFTREEVEKVLVEKKYLVEGEKFEDLPVAVIK